MVCGHDDSGSSARHSVVVTVTSQGSQSVLVVVSCRSSATYSAPNRRRRQARILSLLQIFRSVPISINQLQCRIFTEFFRISCRRPCLSCLLPLHQLELCQTSRLHTPFRQELSIPLLSVPVFWARFMLLLMLNPRKMRQLLFSVTHAKRASILTPHLRHISHHMSAALFMAASLLDRVVLFPII